jgi:hypothetical protein
MSGRLRATDIPRGQLFFESGFGTPQEIQCSERPIFELRQTPALPQMSMDVVGYPEFSQPRLSLFRW